MTTVTLQDQAQAMISKQEKMAESLKGILKQYSDDLDAMNQEFLEGLNKLRQDKMASMENDSRQAENPDKILSEVAQK